MESDEKDLKDSLVKFQPPGDMGKISPEYARLAELVKGALVTLPDGGSLADLSQIPDEELATGDTVQTARIALVLSYLKLIDFLRAKPGPSAPAESQAKLALAFIRHAESERGDTLRLPGQGRTVNDEVLKREVLELRETALRLTRLRDKPGIVTVRGESS